MKKKIIIGTSIATGIAVIGISAFLIMPHNNKAEQTTEYTTEYLTSESSTEILTTEEQASESLEEYTEESTTETEAETEEESQETETETETDQTTSEKQTTKKEKETTEPSSTTANVVATETLPVTPETLAAQPPETVLQTMPTTTVPVTVPATQAPTTQAPTTAPPTTAAPTTAAQTIPATTQVASSSPSIASPMDCKEGVAMINTYRQAAGVADVEWSDALYAAALIRAKQMYESKSLEHYTDMGGEIHAQTGSPKIAVEAWVQSEGHYEYMVRERYHYCAIASYNGYCVAMFSKNTHIMFNEKELDTPVPAVAGLFDGTTTLRQVDQALYPDEYQSLIDIINSWEE